MLGYIVRGPIGGLAWHYLQYLLGLKKLGHNVIFFEDSDDYASCYNPQTGEMTTDPGYGLKFTDEVFKRLNLSDQWSYYDSHTQKYFGKSKNELTKFILSCDVLINVSGVNPLRENLLKIPKRIFIDTDPAFTQIKNLTDKTARANAEKHNLFFTFGENFGAKDCLIPKDGFDWKPTRQPVVIDAWKAAKGNKHGFWTTVMQWDSYRTLEYGGKSFGMKSVSFKDYENLPLTTSEKFKIALGSENAPRDFLQNKGWKIINPLTPTKTPWTYQKFIQNSKAEWSAAKHGYAASRSGWFSERSAAYLASGRPVLTQETGFSKFIECGAGLLSFSSLEEVLAGIETINADYEKHCESARQIAQEFFNHEKVLINLLKQT